MRKLLVTLCVSICSMASFAQQIAKGLTASNGVFIGFYEYKPANYNTNTKYPLIIFLHGIGERGNGTTDLPSILNNGTPNNIKNGSTMTFTWNGKTETFLVLTPQLSPNYGSWPVFYVDEMINYAKKNLSVDTNRVFLTGLSLGGGGVWYYAGSTAENAKKLAGIGVSCGTCQGINWCNIANAKLPVWAFHASNDGTVGVSCTTNAIASINNCNAAVKPYMTIWPDGDHSIWGRVFDEGYTWQNPNIYEWFLGQNKSLPVNVRPVANAGADLNTTTGNGTATLNAGASYDKDGKIVRYVWRKVGGPGYGTIVNAVSTNGIASVSQLWAAGTYTYEVKAIDDRADWSLDTVAVVVTTGGTINQPPVANAGSDISLTLPTNFTTLNGTASRDTDGSIASYAWAYVSGPTQYTIVTPSGATTSLTNMTQGTYIFKLTVTDNGGATASSTVTVKVNAAANQPPVANAGTNATITLPVNSVTLNGLASSDPDGSITAYKWTYVSGPTQYTFSNATAGSTTVSNLVQGTYVFQLTVTDNSGATASSTVQITVNAASGTNGSGGGATPIISINAGPDIIVTLPANSTTLNGSASDSRGPIQAYKWVKIGGPDQYTIVSPNAAVTAITNLVAGTYTFRFDVWDNAWYPRGDTVIVTVKSTTVTSPVISLSAGPDITLTLPTNSTTLNGSASDSRGPISAYKWVKIGGPDQYTLGSPTSAVTTLSNLVAGTYTFRFDVWDNAWYPRGDTVIVTVSPAASNIPVITVNAGPDINLYLPANSTTLSGSAYDSRGPIKAYKWVKIGGPDQYMLGTPDAAITTLSNLVAGIYTFRFDIWDNAWYPRGDTVVITVLNTVTSAPATPVITVNAGPDISLKLPLNNTILKGTAFDSRGPIKAYKWVKIGGPAQYTLGTPDSATTTLSNLVAGTYIFRFDIWDNAWYPRGDTININVSTGTNTAAVTRAAANASAAIVEEEQLLVYPTIVTDGFNLRFNSSVTGKGVINIYNIHGQIQSRTAIEKGSSQYLQYISVSTLPIGTYYVEVIIENKKRITARFIKQ